MSTGQTHHCLHTLKEVLYAHLRHPPTGKHLSKSLVFRISRLGGRSENQRANIQAFAAASTAVEDIPVHLIEIMQYVGDLSAPGACSEKTDEIGKHED